MRAYKYLLVDQSSPNIFYPIADEM